MQFAKFFSRDAKMIVQPKETCCAETGGLAIG
jgi:hypothetical protein